MTGVIKYPAGNSFSVIQALGRLGQKVIYSDDPDRLSTADRIIFPGVGSASPAMLSLREKGLDIWLRDCGKPVLGICLGMQLMLTFSEEGNTQCLDLIPGQVVKFTDRPRAIHIGWNSVDLMRDDPLFRGIPGDTDFYFVHQYYVPVGATAIGHTEFGGRFAAAIRSGQFWGVQFHPEKSAASGMRLLKNFMEI